MPRMKKVCFFIKFKYGMYFYLFCKFKSKFDEYYFNEMVLFTRMINDATVVDR